MIEKIAKTKWCPMVRLESDEGGSFNRHWNMIKKYLGWSGKGMLPDSACNCIASDCMMWQWNTITIGDVDHKEKDGYCGLAR